MKVIRLEDGKGRGMYTTSSPASDIIAGGRSDSVLWPMADDDTKLQDDMDKKNDLYPSTLDEYDIRSLHRFCFNSYEQMERWIYNFEWRVKLAEFGIVMNVYEVDEQWVMIGTTQCTFYFEKATLVGTFSPTTLKWDMPL